jgi:tetratricopeptide (TPR) repeat protein
MTIGTSRPIFRASNYILGSGTLALALVAHPLPAAAQEADSSDNEQVEATEEQGDAKEYDAKKYYERGVEAYRKQRFEEAIQLFLSADRLAPRPALSFNVARAYQKLGEPARELQYYREYLRRGADAGNRKEVERRVRDLQAALAKRGLQQVSVRSNPAGATVSIDGEVRGTTPWTGELPIGSHQLQAQHQGHQSLEVSLTLDAKRAQDLELALPPVASDEALQTASAPAGAHGSVGPRADLSSAADESAEEGLQPWPWVAVGAGGATLAAAGIFELLRRGAESDAEGARYQTEYYDNRDRMSSHQTTARVLLGVSAVLMLSGGVLALVDGAAANTEPVPVALGCDTTTCIGTWMGNF